MPEKPSEQSIFLHAVSLASPADRAAYLEDVLRVVSDQDADHATR
jgi:hypothetical protein